MVKITVAEARKVLSEVLSGFIVENAYIMKKTDEELLKTNLSREFEFDSLDFEEMLVTLYNRYGIMVDAHNLLVKYAFYDEPTVENFIEMVNDNGHEVYAN